MPSSSSSPSSDAPLRNHPMLNQSLNRLTSFKRQVLGRNQPEAYRNYWPYSCQWCVQEFPTSHSFAAHIGAHYRADETSSLMWAEKLVQQLALLEAQLEAHTQALEKALVHELKLLLEAQAQAPPPAWPKPLTPVPVQTAAAAWAPASVSVAAASSGSGEHDQLSTNDALLGLMVSAFDKNSPVSANTISNALDFLFSKQIIQNSSSADVGHRQVLPSDFASSSNMSRQPEDINKENVEVGDEVVASESLVDLDLKL